MSLQFIGSDCVPSYIALSTDIVDFKISGAVLVGKQVYTSDDSNWYIIERDLTLSPYAIPAAFSGSITLGEVSIDQTTPGTTNGVATGISSAGVDGLGNHIAILTAPGSVNSAPLASFPYVFNGTTWDRVRGSATSGLTISNAPISTATAISGQITVTTAGTAIQGSSVSLTNGVYIRALSGNTGKVYVGNDGAGDVTSSNGYELYAGDQIIISVDNLNKLWFDSATNGDKFSWLKG